MNIKKTDEIVFTAAGGTVTDNVERLADIINITSAAPITLINDAIIAVTGTPLEGMNLEILHGGGFTTDVANNISLEIFSRELTDAQAMSASYIKAYYNGTSWDVRILPTETVGVKNIEGANIVDASVKTAAIGQKAVTLEKFANIARGSILLGGAADAAAVLDAKTSGRMLVGNGTDVDSVAMSGAMTMDAAGVTTIASSSITNEMLVNSPLEYKTAVRTITSAEFLAMPDGSLSLIPAGGDNIVNVIVEASLYYDRGTVNYAGGSSVILFYSNDATNSSPCLVSKSGISGISTDTYTQFSKESNANLEARGSAISIGVAGSAYTTGDGTLKVSVVYYSMTV